MANDNEKFYLQSRDLELINLLDSTRLHFTIRQASRWFYVTKSGNKESSYVTAKRRMGKLLKNKYISLFKHSGSQTSIYHSTDLKRPRYSEHKMLMSEFLVSLYECGAEILDVKTEYKELEKSYKVRPDIYVHMRYKGRDYILLVECDISKQFTNGFEYASILEDYDRKPEPKDSKEKLSYDIFDIKPIVVSVCTFQPKIQEYRIGGEEKTFKPYWIRPDMSNLNKGLLWALPVSKK